MSQDLSNVVRQMWASDIQENLEKTLTAIPLATMVEIADGVTKNLPTLNFQSISNYTKGQNVTFGELGTANDQITINQIPLISFQIDAIDEQDNYIDVVPKAIQNAAYKLRENLDGDFFAEIANADYSYGSTGLNNTTGTESGVALTSGASQNVSTVYGTASAHLTDVGAMEPEIVIVTDPFSFLKIQEVGLDKGFTVADDMFKRGLKGSFLGMPIFKSALLSHKVILDLATQPTDGDYFYAKGCKFTFKTTLGTTAGNVLIGASADAARANATAAINGSAGAGTTYVEIDLKYRASFKGGITATNDNSADTLSLVSKRGSIRGSSLLTAAADDFRAETCDNVVMEKGSIFLALRKNVEIEMRLEPGNLQKNYFVYARYGLKTPVSGKERMVRVVIEAKSAEA